METLTRELPADEAVSTRRAGIYARVMAFADRLPRRLRRVVSVVGMVIAMFMTPLAAFAEDPEPADDGVATLFSSATSTITGTLIPAVVAIVLVGALFWLGVRWFQKGKNAGNK